MVPTPGTSLVFPTIEGRKWQPNRFRDRVWLRTIEGAIRNDAADASGSIFEGFTFHMLRHTAASSWHWPVWIRLQPLRA